MATFNVTAPDGRKYRVNAPDGATQDQAIQYVQQKLASQPAPVDPYAQEAESRSPLEKIKGGLASGPINAYLGVKQWLGDLDPVERDVLKQNRAAGSAAPVSSFVSNAATFSPAMLIPGANTAVGAVLTGGVMGAAQPVEEGESRALNTALGAAGGAGGHWVGGKVAKVLTGRGATATAGNPGLTQAQQTAMEEGKRLGIRYTPAQRTGSKVLQQVEAKLESQPMTSGPFFDIKEGNQRVLNRAVAKSIGEASDTVDSSVLAAAHDRIGNIYKLVANDKARPIHADNFINHLAQIEDDFAGMLPTNASSILDNPLVLKAYKLAEDGQATGRQLQDLASKLGKAATNQMTSANGDRQVGMALSAVKDHIDDLLEQGLTGKTLQQFQNARGEYRNLMMLTSRSGVLNPASGNVSLKPLAAVLQQKDKTGYLFGKNQGDLYNTVRSLQAFPGVVGDSGTATRAVIPSPTDFVLSLPFNAAAKAYTSETAANAAAKISGILDKGLLPVVRPGRKYIAPGMGLLGTSAVVRE